MSGEDRAIRWGLYASLSAVTVIAVVISYGHILDLAEDNGEDGFAARAGALTVDGLILTCSLVIVKAARNRSRPPVLAWLMLLLGIAATMAANVAHGLDHGWTGALVSGWPALVATGCFHLVIGEIRRSPDSPSTAGEPSAAWPAFNVEDAGHAVAGDARWETVTAAVSGSSNGIEQGGPVELTAPMARSLDLADEHGQDPGESAGRDRLEHATGWPVTEPTGEVGRAVSGEVEADPVEPGGTELAEVVATARDRFADVLATGDTPSIRALRRELKIGHPRAVRIRDALAEART
ncbi:DUF2637 domain-containing protein [Actinomadura flavalba]|uniref:DUF2637 domain-containing protein n=1 Tax=Actinomadura flavalba TaxID=1120938 RepID=UPI00037D951F|nr:DUF2637 domain-containing protein [Actinomadura flavalba]